MVKSSRPESGRLRLRAAGVPRRADAVGKRFHVRKSAGFTVGPARDVHNPVLELCKQVQPQRLVVFQVPLLL